MHTSQPNNLFRTAVGSIALAAIAFSASCKDKESDDTAGIQANVFPADENNFNYSGAMHVPVITTASGVDLNICWDQLVQDIQCHDMDPNADIDNVGLVRLPYLSQAEVSERLAGQGLQQADISGYVELNTNGETCLSLADMNFYGTMIDVPSEYNEDGGTYLMIHTTGTEPGIGARMLTFLEPKADSKVTGVDTENGCGVLDFTADMRSLTPLSMPAAGPWVVDWSGLTQDGQGIALQDGTVDGLMVAFYADLEPADLEPEFFDLELIPTSMWQLDIESGTIADLAEATNGTSNFTGIDTAAAGTWALALRCSTCQNPAPLFLTILEGTE